MAASSTERSTAFLATLQATLDRMRDVSSADIVALYPYDAESDSMYAPVALGLPETDLVGALPDIADQLRRFRLDETQGKIPEDLLPSHYGPHAWLLATRRTLVATDAYHEVDGTFVRRHKVRAILALPLLVGTRVVALLYLNYVDGSPTSSAVDVSDPEYTERVQAAANEVAARIDEARHADEAQILREVTRLVSDLSAPPQDVDDDEALSTFIRTGLQQLATAADVDSVALFVPASGDRGLMAIAVVGSNHLMEAVSLPLVPADVLMTNEQIISLLARDNLYPVAAVSPHGDHGQGILLFSDRDALLMHRRLPTVSTMLRSAADLIRARLTNSQLVESLGETNRTLGAITRLSTRLLHPGARQADVLRTAVVTLTDPSLPELDFEFANVYLLETLADGTMEVAESAGATASPEIPSNPDDRASQPGEDVRRVPLWVGEGRRKLDRRDVLAYAATRRRAVVVAPLDQPDDHFIAGYPEERLERIEAPMLGRDGTTRGQVRTARLRWAADRSPVRDGAGEDAVYRLTDEFTLDADMFDTYGHGSLIRVFMPFGRDESGERATGVLEAGYHVSHKQRLERVQIEALRACVATVAVAVETARAYGDLALRARQLEIIGEVSRTIATSIDLEQTLHLVARNMARSVDASLCLIALMEDDDSAWYGAAASTSEDVWRTRRMERPERSIVFEVVDEGRPMVVEDALNHPLISNYFARMLNIRSLMALPLLAGDAGGIGAVLLAQRDRTRVFTAEEVEAASGLASQAAMAIRNARQHAREEEEQHVQKDVVLIGFGQWGRKAYQHLVLLKSFFNFRTHVVERDTPGRREALAEDVQRVLDNGDLFYWDSDQDPARNQLGLELEPSCYVITYIATPAETHLPILKQYYDLSNVVLIEKPLGAPPEEYKAFLDSTDNTVEIVAADHYWFKMEVRLLELLLTEERNLRAFLDDIEEVEIEILEEQAPTGSGAQIGMIADLIPHAFAVLSLLTPLDRLRLDPHRPLQVGRYQPEHSHHETYARLQGAFEHRGRQVRVTIDVGKGVADAKWIKLSGERRLGGRRSFYKFDFSRGEAIDGTQSALRAATRPIRQPGVRDNAHLSMLRHVIEKKHPAVAILSIREALRANARVQELERMANELLESGQWTPYQQGKRPAFADPEMTSLPLPRAGKEAVGE